MLTWKINLLPPHFFREHVSRRRELIELVGFFLSLFALQIEVNDVRCHSPNRFVPRPKRTTGVGGEGGGDGGGGGVGEEKIYEVKADTDSSEIPTNFGKKNRRGEFLQRVYKIRTR